MDALRWAEGRAIRMEAFWLMVNGGVIVNVMVEFESSTTLSLETVTESEPASNLV